ncbi:MAG: helix-turn-helix domain-containing protein [Lachnospiraceae bacterium]|nr:helix-turn-helix domain-containing protein [Lachnospiraceae bacterium]
MSLGTNIQFLRKLNKLTQEQFAERMGISRQTVSRWEADEVTPELNKLVEICAIFSCKLDELVREDLSSKDEIYSEVEIRKVAAFRMARYVMISPQPESDVQNYMKEWGKKSGLLAADPNAKLIGWDFPFVSQELQTRFGLHGYVAAYMLPEGFETNCPGVEYAQNKEAEYAVITVTEPMIRPFERIPTGYKCIMEYLQANNFKEKLSDDIVGCFEHEYEKDGVWYMDIYVHAASVTKMDAYSTFN